MLRQLLLITQLHRSGGTLFSQLLDGHSAIQAHPHELFIGKPEKWDWPKLSKILDSPEQIFSSLYEAKIAEIGTHGNFIKPGTNPQATKQVVPFTYNAEVHREQFCTLFASAPVKTQRLAIQLYLSTFFKAWPEYKDSGSERYVSCFLPHLLLHRSSLGRLFTDFPDVFLVNLLRRPDAWISSLVNHISLRLEDTEAVKSQLLRWRTSVQIILSMHRNPVLKTFSTSYEALVTNTDAELRRFCQVAGIPFEPILLMPTVGGYAVLPNSSYQRTQTGVNRESLNPAVSLPESITTLIDKSFLPIYHKANKVLQIPQYS